MHTVIAAEALFFVLAFAKGAGIMLGYDILRAFRREFPHGGRLVAAEDFFYWVFAWIFVFLMFRDRNYGQIRGYVLAALILGMLFYILLLSRRILLVFSTFFGFLSRMIAGLFRLILMPAGKSVKKMKKRKQTRRRRDAAQRRGKLGISTVIVVLIAVFLLRGHTMDQRNAAYVEELAQLQNKIDAEEARTQDIADLEAYMQTDEYAEQVAKDKLGLVYEDEIIFKPEEN